MISLYDVTGGEIYKNINRTILDVNVTNIYWIIMGGKYDAIYTDDYSRHGYYIIKFSSYLYTLQEGLRVDGQVISSGEMVCEGNYLFPINIDYHYYVLQKNKSINTIVS